MEHAGEALRKHLEGAFLQKGPLQTSSQKLLHIALSLWERVG